jgi:hypothetical protein
MIRIALLACLLVAVTQAALAADHPGYGVVQSITPLRAKAAEPSASTGASAPSRSKPAQTYLVRVLLDDGSIQVRTVKSIGVRVGQRALVTNAGDVLPE